MREDAVLLNRREFIKGLFALTTCTLLPSGCFIFKGKRRVIILYTNDQHSRIEPFPDTHPEYAGRGGFARRSHLIKKIKEKFGEALVLDAGDLFQGTPYFNLFKGKVEIMGMNQMGYDAMTLGNHDFDCGVDCLATNLQNARFYVITSNYETSHPLLKHTLKKFHIFNRGGFRIGVVGAGISPEGLIPPHLFEGMKWLPPLPLIDEIAHHLKEKENCDLVICLSHLGYKYQESDRIDDIKLALNSSFIDIIIGGHTHTFLKEPVLVKNKKGKQVLITQMGWAGLYLGRIDITDGPDATPACISCSCYSI